MQFTLHLTLLLLLVTAKATAMQQKQRLSKQEMLRKCKCLPGFGKMVYGPQLYPICYKPQCHQFLPCVDADKIGIPTYRSVVETSNKKCAKNVLKKFNKK